MLPFGFLADFDHLSMPDLAFFTPTIATEHEVALGEEVFVAGLFRHHHGKGRSIPIVRVGNLPAFDEEQVQTSIGLHRLREDGAVRANAVLGGLHHEYFLAPTVAPLEYLRMTADSVLILSTLPSRVDG
jgi:hypothetical protein